MINSNKNSFYINDEVLPSFWYNFVPQLPGAIPPVLNPPDSNAIETLQKIRPKSLQELEQQKIPLLQIPEDIIEKYRLIGRPTPLMRANKLEEALEVSARIYLKREDLLPTGSFKLNTSIPQAYFAHKEGFRGVVSETGAGQWGVALSFAASLYGLMSKTFMARVSFEQKPYRRILMNLYGGEVFPSPSELTKAGRDALKQNPTHPGSIGSGISDAIETALENPDYAYLSGSNLVHVLIHQTVIGMEVKRQLEELGEFPDYLVACVGGGSNLGGLMLPFLPEVKKGNINLLAAESATTPRLTNGEYRYDQSDPSGYTPLVKSYTLGKEYVPPANHVGGLRQHNGSPAIGILRHSGLLDAKAYTQDEVFKAGALFTKLYGVVPAPETCHALKAVMDLAKSLEKDKKKSTICTCFSGHGLLDLSGYEDVYLNRREEMSIAEPRNA
ncbi:MAG: TrpB-like pyridoxal phosphate-dependent enzyme [Thermoleophilia bacterium]